MPFKDKEYGKEYDRNRYIKNKEIVKIRTRQWKKNNPERIISEEYKNTRKIWANKNKEKLKTQNILYRLTHKDEKYKYQIDNPEIGLKANKKHLERLGKNFDMTSMEYAYAIKSWSNTIKKLDNRMCKLCDSTEGINAHHIMPKSDFPELSFDLDNGITLCKKCHLKTHWNDLY